MNNTGLRGLAALAGVALVAVVGFGAVAGVESVADDLRPKAESALVEAGLTSVEVDVDGREVTLAGGSASELAAATAVVEAIRGVRWAHISRIEPAVGPRRALGAGPSLRFEAAPQGHWISGVVADAETAAALKTAAAALFGGTVRGDLTVDPGAAPADWPSGVPDVFADLTGVKGLTVVVDGASGSIEIGGRIESRAGADRVEALVTADVPDLRVDSRIDIDPAGLTAVDAETLNSATVYFAAGASALDDLGGQTLDAAADVLNRNPTVDIAIVGHAGPSDRAEGRALSDARVAGVTSSLVQHGVAPIRITMLSHGSERTGATDAYARQYRRVDIVVKES